MYRMDYFEKVNFVWSGCGEHDLEYNGKIVNHYDILSAMSEEFNKFLKERNLLSLDEYSDDYRDLRDGFCKNNEKLVISCIEKAEEKNNDLYKAFLKDYNEDLHLLADFKLSELLWLYFTFGAEAQRKLERMKKDVLNEATKPTANPFFMCS